jgi:hypothetical protein
MPENISELFAGARGDVYQVVRLSGTPLYSSDTLQRNYINAMAKTGKTIPIVNTIKGLMDRGILTPVYSTDKLIKSLAKLQPVQIKGFAGLVTHDKKVYIFVETEANIFSFTSNDALATVTIHELIHYMASYHLRDFYNIFKNTLEEFYVMYFTKYLSCDPKKLSGSKLTDLVKFINFKLEPNAFQIPNVVLKQYFAKIITTFKDASTLEEDEFNKKVTNIIVLIKILQKLALSGSTQYFTKAVMTNKEIVTPLYVAYKHMLGVDPMSAKNLCFQELWSTSEVIAIPAMVKTPNQNVYKAIKKL